MRVRGGGPDRRARFKPEPLRCFGCDTSHALARHHYRGVQLVVYNIAQTGVERFKEVGGWIPAVKEHIVTLVCGIEITARLNAGKHPCHPVSGFENVVAIIIDFRRFVIKLPYFWEHPLA